MKLSPNFHTTVWKWKAQAETQRDSIVECHEQNSSGSFAGSCSRFKLGIPSSDASRAFERSCREPSGSLSLSLSSSPSRSFNFSLSLSILACTSIRVTVCDWSAEAFVRKTDDSRLKEATWSPEMELSRAPASERSWLRFRALLLLTQRVNFPGRERCTKKRCNCLLWLGIPNENFFQYALNVFRHRHLMTIFARFLREFDTFSFRYFRVNSNAVTKLSSRDTFV